MMLWAMVAEVQRQAPESCTDFQEYTTTQCVISVIHLYVTVRGAIHITKIPFPTNVALCACTHVPAVHNHWRLLIPVGTAHSLHKPHQGGRVLGYLVVRPGSILTMVDCQLW